MKYGDVFQALLPESTNYNNIKIQYLENMIKIGSTTIKIKSIKSNYLLGLNEAFSQVPNELAFVSISNFYNKIVNAKPSESYTAISQLLLNELVKTKEQALQLQNQIKSLLLLLFPKATPQQISNIINECGGMINYIIPRMLQFGFSPQQ